MNPKRTCQYIKPNGETCRNRPQKDSKYCHLHRQANVTGKVEGLQELLENITDASKNARGIYFLYVGFLVYCALTVISTTDRQLVLPQEKAKLPIINVEISVIIFFIVAPLVAIFIYWYFQLYLQKLKDLKDHLISAYPDYDLRKLYPWMLNIVDEPRSDATGKMRQIVVKISLWWLLPGVLLLFPLRFICKHDPVWSWVVGLLYPLIGAGLVIWFWCQHESLKITFNRAFWFQNYGKSLLGGLMILFGLVLFPAGNYLAFNGIRLIIVGTNIEPVTQFLHIDLSYQKLIEEPHQDYETLYWLDLGGLHLEGANFTGAILKKTDFRGADLTRANLMETNIEKADFKAAQLFDANFRNAQLGSANFWNAQLSGAKFEMAQLSGAKFGGAQLSGADFGGAQLSGANFMVAQLDRAYFREARLSGAIFIEAQLPGAYFAFAQLDSAYFQYAQLDSAYFWRAQLDNADFREAQLDSAYFWRAQLDNADFREAQLDNADFRGAQLDNADFREAQLSGAKFGVLVVEERSPKIDDSREAILTQLANARTLAGAFLDSTLCADVLEVCPYLLEVPAPKK